MRLARKVDSFDLLVVRAASWRAAYGKILPARTLARLTDRWDREFPPGTWLVEREGLVLGYCITSAGDLEQVPAAVEIRELYLFPDVWRNGLGTRLLDAVLVELARRGARETFLDVLQANRGGIAFYEANGFRRVPDGDRMVDVDGARLVTWRFHRSL